MCNLYPFEDTIANSNSTLPDAIEEIDIGGVTLLRAAAKNHERVSVLSAPADYAAFLQAFTKGNGDVGADMRKLLALKAFEATATYDEAISNYFRQQYASSSKSTGLVQSLSLRYGANPHQKPAQAYVTSGELPFKGRCFWLSPWCLRKRIFLKLIFSTRWFSWLYQPFGCIEFLRIGIRITGKLEFTCSGIIQACFSSGSGCGDRAERH